MLDAINTDKADITSRLGDGPLMWRWAISLLVVLVLQLEVAHATVTCGERFFAQENAYSGSLTGNVSPYVGVVSNGVWRYYASVNSDFEGAALNTAWSIAIRARVAAGSECPPGYNYVFMPYEEYSRMIQAASVVVKLQEGYDLLVIATAIISAFIGLIFGYRFGRGAGQ